MAMLGWTPGRRPTLSVDRIAEAALEVGFDRKLALILDGAATRVSAGGTSRRAGRRR